MHPERMESPFPDVRWGAERSSLRKPFIALSATTVGSALVKALTPIDRRLLLKSGGRLTVLGPIGAPVLLLTTTGRKSGLLRTTPLLYARDGKRVCVVGSNFGQSRHPLWSDNLMAHAHATVRIGSTDIEVTATLLEGAERERMWKAFVAVARTYDAYRGRTTRDLRMFALNAVTTPSTTSR